VAPLAVSFPVEECERLGRRKARALTAQVDLEWVRLTFTCEGNCGDIVRLQIDTANQETVRRLLEHGAIERRLSKILELLGWTLQLNKARAEHWCPKCVGGMTGLASG
jgi:hypothetical protein